MADTIAREMFRTGDRVRLSADGLFHFKHALGYSSETRGTVQGFGRKPEIVRIIRDGYKTTGGYHASLWQRSRA